MPKQEFDHTIKEYLRTHDEWVIDGNYTNNPNFYDRLKLADYVVLLQYPKETYLHGVIERERKYKHRHRSDMAVGCNEELDQVFLQYVATFHKHKIKSLSALVHKYKSKDQIKVLYSRDELNKWLNTLEEDTSCS